MKWLPKLIPDWRLAWRFASVQAAVLLALLSGLQAEVLPLISPLFAVDVWPWVSGSLALAVVVLRLVSQDSLQIQREQVEWDEARRQDEAVRRRWAAETARDKAQAQPDPHRRPADVPPTMGAALLLGIGLVLALLACAVWLLLKAAL
jgi:hypothetical protein